MDSFNSDELVPSEDEATLNPFYNVGQRTCEEMLAFAMEDRIKSKKRMKNLRDIGGAPGQARARQRWFNFFKAYIGILGEDVKATPSGELFVRFFAHIVERLKSHIIGKPAYSKDTLKVAIHRLTSRLVFEYKDFRLTPHHARRLDTLITSLVREGKLTVGKWRKQQWIGFLTLRRILTTYIADALSSGVHSWDVRISRWLSLVLISSADSRGGEIARSTGYKGEEYLIWEDIEIMLVDGEEFHNLECQVTLRWEKFSKDDPTSYRKVRWRPLEYSESIVVDPIALLLVHAMRHGQVQGKCIEEVLEHIAAEPSMTLAWTNPTWPVIPVIEKYSGAALDFSKPASTSQCLYTLHEACRLDGFLEDPWLHDLRRGSAKDINQVKRIHAGVDSRVAAALGQSNQSHNSGVTARYAERESLFIHNEKEHLRQDAFGPKVAVVPYQAPHGIAKSQALNEASANTPALSRKQVAHRLEKESKKRWVDEAVPVVPQKRRSTIERKDTKRQARTSEATVDAASTLLLASKSSTSNSKLSSDDSNLEVDLSVEDETEALRVLDVICCRAPIELDDHEDELVADALIEDSGFEQNAQGPLELPVLEFINYFARINTVRNAIKKTTAQLAAAGHCVGNSRDPLSQFRKKCANKDLGCEFEHHYLQTLSHHETQTCIYRENALPNEILRRAAPRDWECLHCHKTFLTRRTLNFHERYANCDGSREDWEPKACDKGCTSGFVYITEARYKDHIGHYHAVDTSFIPKQCPLKDKCGQQKIFETNKKLTDHLFLTHRLTREQIQLYIPSIKAVYGSFTPAPCPVGKCRRGNKNIPDRHSLLRHLMGRDHKLTESQANEIIAGARSYAVNGDEDDVETDVLKGFPCPFNNICGNTKPFTTPHDLKRHLKGKKHQCHEDEASQISGVPTRAKKQQ